MIKILNFAKKSWYIMIIIILLLFVQANSDLALPEYTSNIVDVGIQTKGIDSPIPDRMRDSTYHKLGLFMNEEELTLFEKSYTKEGELYELVDIDKEQPQYEQLYDLLVEKEVLLSMLYSTEEEASTMRASMLEEMGIPADTDMDAVIEMLPKEVLMQMSDGVSEKLAGMSELIGKSAAISFVINEYEEMGINVDKVQMKYLRTQGAQMLLIAFIGMIASVLVAFLSTKMAASASRDLRKRVFDKVVHFSNEEMNHFSTASLITRSTNDIQQVQMVLMMIFRFVAFAPIIGIGGLMKVLKTNTGMTWIIAVAIGVILVLVMVLMIVAMPKFKKMQTLIDRLNLVSREILTGIPVIRAFGKERYEEERFDGASRDLMKTQLFTHRSMAIMMPTMMLIMNAITALIIWVGAHGIDLGNLQVGDMMAFITYTMQIVFAFLMITMVSIMLPRAAVAATRIQEILDTEIIIEEKKQPKNLPERLEGVVTFEDVSFSYPNAKEDALEHISFTANPGETTAIIGSTGCGKSTLVQLIPRLYDVTGGAVKVDGIDIRDLKLTELRDAIGFVPQKGVLFSGTIESNIGFGIKDIPSEQIEEAARIAQATEFIESKPEKYKDEIAQGGTNVSGGQKQRLSIARAIAKKPKIYVFDDSFSALDYKTDKVLRKELGESTKDATVIIVAQRISTILQADKILVLDEGKIVGSGRHEELLRENDVYRQIASSQLSEEEINKTSESNENRKGDK